MGCACRKAKEKAKAITRASKLRAGEIETVSLNVLKTRRSACRACKYATKNPHPKFAAFGGLTSQSTCKQSKRKINECLKDPLYSCPEDYFTCES